MIAAVSPSANVRRNMRTAATINAGAASGSVT
jgi:hypothetical protein